AIADDDSLSQPSRRSHAIGECVNECIDATANILHIENENVDTLQHLVGRFSRLAVKRMDGQAGLSIDTVPGLDHVVLNVATYSVLRTKQRAHVNPRMLMQKIRSMAIAVVD